MKMQKYSIIQVFIYPTNYSISHFWNRCCEVDQRDCLAPHVYFNSSKTSVFNGKKLEDFIFPFPYCKIEP